MRERWQDEVKAIEIEKKQERYRENEKPIAIPDAPKDLT